MPKAFSFFLQGSAVKIAQKNQTKKEQPKKSACQSLIGDGSFPIVFGWSKIFESSSFIWTLLQKSTFPVCTAREVGPLYFSLLSVLVQLG